MLDGSLAYSSFLFALILPTAAVEAPSPPELSPELLPGLSRKAGKGVRVNPLNRMECDGIGPFCFRTCYIGTKSEPLQPIKSVFLSGFCQSFGIL